MAGPRRCVQTGLITVSILLLTVGCGDTSDPTVAPADTASPVDTTPTVDTTPEPVPIVEITDDVVFYPACGNETLDHDGRTWFPVSHVGFPPDDGELARRQAAIDAAVREPIPTQRPEGLRRVSAPGPGDDIGTLVVWADDVARWTAVSGDLDVWMVAEPFEYPWVC